MKTIEELIAIEEKAVAYIAGEKMDAVTGGSFADRRAPLHPLPKPIAEPGEENMKVTDEYMQFISGGSDADNPIPYPEYPNGAGRVETMHVSEEDMQFINGGRE